MTELTIKDYYEVNMANEELKQPVTKEYLGQFTEDVLLPAIGELLKPLQDDIKVLQDETKALAAKVTMHLELSDKRYLELKHREKLLAS